MNVGETLKFIRKSRKLTQKAVATSYIDRSSYARVEKDERDIKIKDLREILNNMAISPSEFFSLARYDEQESFRELFYHCGNHLQSKKRKQSLLSYYFQLSQNENKNQRELSNYIAIKNYFHQFWKEIEKINKSDLKIVFEDLMAKSYFYQYDYIIISNIIPYFTAKEADLIISKAIPIKDEKRRDHTTKKFAYNAVLSIITKRIYEAELDYAWKYIQLAEKQDSTSQNHGYRMTLHYLKNLWFFLQTREPRYYEEMLNYVKILRSIGDIDHADHIELEMKALLNNEDMTSSFPVGLIKEG